LPPIRPRNVKLFAHVAPLTVIFPGTGIGLVQRPRRLFVFVGFAHGSSTALTTCRVLVDLRIVQGEGNRSAKARPLLSRRSAR